MRRSAAASGCGRCWSSPAATCSTSTGERALRVGARGRVHPRLFADPRRSAVHGRRRSQARQADPAPRLRRMHRDPRRRFAPRSGLRDARRRGDPRGSVRPRRAGRSSWPAPPGPAGMAGGQMMDLMAGEMDARPRRRHPAPAAQDRRADRLVPRGRRDHGPGAAGRAHGPARLCPRRRPRLPDRRRPARHRGRGGEGRQARRQGRGGRQGDVRLAARRRARAPAGGDCWSSRRSIICTASARRPTCSAPSPASRWSATIRRSLQGGEHEGLASIRARSIRSRSAIWTSSAAPRIWSTGW